MTKRNPTSTRTSTRNSTPKSKPVSARKTPRSGGVDIDAQKVNVGSDLVGRDKLFAGDDIIQTQQYIERQTNVTLPRGVQISIGVAAIAIAVIAFTFLRPSQPVLANGEFDSLDGWEVNGNVQLVEVAGERSLIRPIRAAELAPDTSVEQPVDMPDTSPGQRLELTFKYRLPPGGVAGGTVIVEINDHQVDCPLILADATDWKTVQCDISEYAGVDQAIFRIGYRASSARAAGLLSIAFVRTINAVWIGSVAINLEDSNLVAQTTAQPSPTPSLTATGTPSPTDISDFSVTPSRTSEPTVTLVRPTRTAQQPTSPTAQLRAVTVEPLSFSWSTGAFRDWGINEAGQNVWAQTIIIQPSGGAPPYTVLFNGQQQAELTFEVFGRFCEGQRGELIVQSADGQSSNEVITVKHPICPTHTPTPTSTAINTSTATETNTPTTTATNTPTTTYTPTPTFTFTPVPIPQPALTNGSFEDPAIASESLQYAASIPGWALSFGSEIEINNHNSIYGLLAVHGAQLVELDSQNPSGIYQDIATVAGASYRVTFAFAARPNTAADDNVLEVRWNDQSIAVLSADGSGQSSAQWNYYTYDVVATSGTSRLEFRDLGIPSSQGTLLDNVSMALVP